MKKACAVLALGSIVLLGALGQAQQRAVEWPGSGAPRAASSGTAQDPAQPQSAQSSGQTAFDRVCKVCHGPEARGDGGPRLVPFSREYDELLAIVREGTADAADLRATDLGRERLPDRRVSEILVAINAAGGAVRRAVNSKRKGSPYDLIGELTDHQVMTIQCLGWTGISSHSSAPSDALQLVQAGRVQRVGL
jgi:mono/diheme cytochrome c family protein